MVITGSVDKFFSVGLDFKELTQSKSKKVTGELMYAFLGTVRRLLIFPMPTIAAINGHCFAGGFILGLCCDYRIGLNNCGTFCMSEVSLELPLPIGISELFQQKVPPNTARTTILTGYKYTCKEALKAQIVDEMVMERKDLLPKAIGFAQLLSQFGKNRTNYTKLKYDMYYVTVDKLKEGQQSYRRLAKL